jgi:pilus assembly protein CpaE
MDLPSLKSSKVAFGMLKLMNIDKNRIKLILNRADSKVGLTVNDVEKAIGTRVYCKIPSDRVIPRSVNMGIPAVLSHPKSDVGRSFDFLAERLTADYFQN